MHEEPSWGGRPHKPESMEDSAEAPPPPAPRQAPLVCISVTAPPKSMNKDLFKWELSKRASGALPPPHYQVLGPVSLLSEKLEASSMLVERTVLFPA